MDEGAATDPAARLRRRDVRGAPRQQRPPAGLGRDHRRPALGLRTAAAAGHPRAHALWRPHAQPVDLRHQPLPRDRRRATAGRGRPQRRTALAAADGRLPRRNNALFGLHDHQRAGAERAHVRAGQPDRTLLHLGARRGQRRRALAFLHGGGFGRPGRPDVGRPARRQAGPHLGVGASGQLRPRTRLAVLGHRRAAALFPHRAPRHLGHRRPHPLRAVFQLDGGAAAGQWVAGVVLPAPAV